VKIIESKHVSRRIYLHKAFWARIFVVRICFAESSIISLKALFEWTWEIKGHE